MTPETDDKEVNVEKIMEEIRETIRKKKEMGLYTDEEVDSVSGMKLRINVDNPGKSHVPESSLRNIQEKWDPTGAEPIVSHRELLGPMIVICKKILRKLLKPVAKILFARQTQFNLELLRILHEFESKNNCFQRDISHVSGVFHERYVGLHNGLQELKNNLNCFTDKFTGEQRTQQQEIVLHKRRLNRILAILETKYGLNEKDIISLSKERKRLMDHIYFLFEQKYRGSEEDIKERQRRYLPYFLGKNNVLDIGCGRGEFLALLGENGISAVGIDLNEEMVFRCKEKGSDVSQADAISYLESIPEESLGGVFAAHIIEHLNHNVLLEFIQLCQAKLKKGGYVIFETPNPLSILVSASYFHLDLSHIKPIHPDGIKFLMESNGFENVSIEYLSPFPKEAQLPVITLSDSMSEYEKNCFGTLNENIIKINDLIFGYQDYCIISKK